MYEDKIEKSMTLLDSSIWLQPNWIDNIDLHALNMCDSMHCILHQLFKPTCQAEYRMGINGYIIGLTKLGLSNGYDNDCAFSLPSILNEYVRAKQYDILTAEWRNAILNRRKEKM